MCAVSPSLIRHGLVSVERVVSISWASCHISIVHRPGNQTGTRISAVSTAEKTTLWPQLMGISLCPCCIIGLSLLMWSRLDSFLTSLTEWSNIEMSSDRPKHTQSTSQTRNRIQYMAQKGNKTLPSWSFCWCISSYMTQNTFPRILNACLRPNCRSHAIHHLGHSDKFSSLLPPNNVQYLKLWPYGTT